MGVAGGGGTGAHGFSHEVVLEQHRKEHPNPKAVECHRCGSPQMIKACNRMLAELGVETSRTACDEF